MQPSGVHSPARVRSIQTLPLAARPGSLSRSVSMWIRRMARCTSLKIQPPAIAAAADAHGLLLSCRSSDHGEELIRDEAGDVTSPASFPNHNVTYFALPHYSWRNLCSCEIYSLPLTSSCCSDYLCCFSVARNCRRSGKGWATEYGRSKLQSKRSTKRSSSGSCSWNDQLENRSQTVTASSWYEHPSSWARDKLPAIAC